MMKSENIMPCGDMPALSPSTPLTSPGGAYNQYMRTAAFALAFSLAGFVAGGTFFIAVSLVLAWSGPTSAPPHGNVAAPINVGSTDQVKNAGLGINSLAIFGNAILSGASRYLNFGATTGANGYGFRDNAGTMEFKDSSGTWRQFLSTTNLAASKWCASNAGGTAIDCTQDPPTGGATASWTGSCNNPYSGCATPACPSGYVRTGCSSQDGGQYGGAIPYNSDQCIGAQHGTTYIYCVK